VIFLKKKTLLLLFYQVQNLTSSCLLFYFEFLNIFQIYLLRKICVCITSFAIVQHSKLLRFITLTGRRPTELSRRNCYNFFQIYLVSTFGNILGRNPHFYYDTKFDRTTVWLKVYCYLEQRQNTDVIRNTQPFFPSTCIRASQWQVSSPQTHT
jgi:hypothetical protein